METRGRRRSLTPINLRALDATRKRLLKKAGGEYEIHWDDIIAAARTPAIHRTTKHLGYVVDAPSKAGSVAARAPTTTRVRGPQDAPPVPHTVPDQSPTSPRPVPDQSPTQSPTQSPMEIYSVSKHFISFFKKKEFFSFKISSPKPLNTVNFHR